MRVAAAQRRQQLIEATIRLMWRDGVEHASLRAIAREAHAPLASVHYCFDDKDDLMGAVVEYWLAELVGSLVDDVEVEGGLRPTVKRMAEEFWISLEANPPNVLAQLELALWAMRADTHGSLAASIYTRYGEVLGDLFERACTSSGTRPTIPTQLFARALVGILDAGSLQYLADPDSGTAKQVYDLMIDSLISAAGA